MSRPMKIVNDGKTYSYHYDVGRNKNKMKPNGQSDLKCFKHWPSADSSTNLKFKHYLCNILLFQ